MKTKKHKKKMKRNTKGKILMKKKMKKKKNIIIKYCKFGVHFSQLDTRYQKGILWWYDDPNKRVSSGKDEQVLVMCLRNKNKHGILRVNKNFKRKGMSRKYGQNIKVWEKTCTGSYKNVYTTLKYFLNRGFSRRC